MANTLNGLSRYVGRVPQCTDAIRQLADLIRTTSARGQEAALDLSTAMHGLDEFAADPTCRKAVQHAAPIIQSATKEYLLSGAAVIAPAAARKGAVPSLFNEVQVSNLVVGLARYHRVGRSDEKPVLESAIVSLAQLIAAQNEQLASLEPKSLAKLVHGLAQFCGASEPKAQEACREALAQVIKAIKAMDDQGSAPLDRLTALQLTQLRLALSAPDIDQLPDAKRVAQLVAAELNKLHSPAAARGMRLDDLLERWDRLEYLPDASVQKAVGEIGREVHARAERFPVINKPVTARSGVIEFKQPSVEKGDKVIHGIRELRAPQKESDQRHFIVLADHPSLQQYLFTLADVGKFIQREEGKPKELGFEQVVRFDEQGTRSHRYLFTVDEGGIKVALEDAKNEKSARQFGGVGEPTRYLHHTNLSKEACMGGEVWFHPDGKTVTLNADSGRFGIEYNPDADEVIGTLTLALWESTVRLWESRGYVVEPRQRWFSPEPVSNLLPLLDNIDTKSEAQLKRITESMTHAQLRFEAGDVAELPKLLAALQRLPGVGAQAPDGGGQPSPIERAGVALARRVLYATAAALRKNTDLGLTFDDLDGLREAIKPFEGEAFQFATANLLGIAQGKAGGAAAPLLAEAVKQIKDNRLHRARGLKERIARADAFERSMNELMQHVPQAQSEHALVIVQAVCDFVAGPRDDPALRRLLARLVGRSLAHPESWPLVQVMLTELKDEALLPKKGLDTPQVRRQYLQELMHPKIAGLPASTSIDLRGHEGAAVRQFCIGMFLEGPCGLDQHQLQLDADHVGAIESLLQGKVACERAEGDALTIGVRREPWAMRWRVWSGWPAMRSRCRCWPARSSAPARQRPCRKPLPRTCWRGWLRCTRARPVTAACKRCVCWRRRWSNARRQIGHACGDRACNAGPRAGTLHDARRLRSCCGARAGCRAQADERQKSGKGVGPEAAG